MDKLINLDNVVDVFVFSINLIKAREVCFRKLNQLTILNIRNGTLWPVSDKKWQQTQTCNHHPHINENNINTRVSRRQEHMNCSFLDHHRNIYRPYQTSQYTHVQTPSCRMLLDLCSTRLLQLDPKTRWYHGWQVQHDCDTVQTKQKGRNAPYG